MTQTETQPRRSWLRRLVVVSLGLVILLLLVRTGVDLWASRRVTAQMEKLEAQHGSLDIGTLLVVPVPEEDNRARAMRAAAGLLVEHEKMQASLTRFQAQRGPATVPEDLRAFVEANHAALRVADEARGRGRSNWEVDYATMNYSPGLLEIRRLSNALYLEARMALDVGRPDEAARALATGLALSASLRQEPSLVTQLIRCAVALQQFEGVQRLLTESEPSEAALDLLSSALAENRTPAPMHIGLIGELKTFNAALGRAADGGVAGYLSTMNRTGTVFEIRPLSWLLQPLFRVAHAQYLEELGRLLDVERGPRPRPVSMETQSRRPLLHGVPMAIGGLERAMDSGDLHHSALAMTELAVALRRYRLTHREYPEDLAALTPAYIANVPSDPLSGKLPVYARQGAGFTLHSEAAKDDTRLHAAAISWNVAR